MCMNMYVHEGTHALPRLPSPPPPDPPRRNVLQQATDLILLFPSVLRGQMHACYHNGQTEKGCGLP